MKITSPPPFEQLIFLTEARLYNKCPEDRGREIALVGRSNTGKSSLINAISRNRKMAITSRLPGRTRGLVFFSWHNTDLRLVDLPGYGFARTDANTRKQWYQQINLYLEQRQSLMAMLLLIDCRRQAGETEKRLVRWCQHGNMSVRVCLTKVDKISKNQQIKAMKQVESQLALERTHIYLCSVRQPETIDSLRSIIVDCLCPEPGAD